MLALAAAAPLENYYAIKETHTVPPSFTCIGDAPKDHRMHLSVGLKQSRFDELERHLFEGNARIKPPDVELYSPST